MTEIASVSIVRERPIPGVALALFLEMLSEHCGADLLRLKGLVKLAETLCTEEGVPALGNADAYYKRSDHANFAKLGIPVAFLFSDVHEDYHKTTDTADKIDVDKIDRALYFVTAKV